MSTETIYSRQLKKKTSEKPLLDADPVLRYLQDIEHALPRSAYFQRMLLMRTGIEAALFAAEAVDKQKQELQPPTSNLEVTTSFSHDKLTEVIVAEELDILDSQARTAQIKSVMKPTKLAHFTPIDLVSSEDYVFAEERGKTSTDTKTLH